MRMFAKIVQLFKDRIYDHCYEMTVQEKEKFNDLRSRISPIEEVKARVDMNDEIDISIVEMFVINAQLPLKEWISEANKIVTEDLGKGAFIRDLFANIYFCGLNDENRKVYIVEDYVDRFPRKVTYDIKACYNPFALAEIYVKCDDNEEVKARLLDIQQNIKPDFWPNYFAKEFIEYSKDPRNVIRVLFDSGDFPFAKFKLRVDLGQDNILTPYFIAAHEAMKKAGII